MEHWKRKGLRRDLIGETGSESEPANNARKKLQRGIAPDLIALGVDSKAHLYWWITPYVMGQFKTDKAMSNSDGSIDLKAGTITIYEGSISSYLNNIVDKPESYMDLISYKGTRHDLETVPNQIKCMILVETIFNRRESRKQ